MAASYISKIAGLHTSPNETGSVPEGALVQADNCVIRNKDVIESRRGHETLSYATAATPKEVFFYNNTLLVHAGTTLARDTGSAFTAYSGSYTEPDSTLLRMKGVEAQQSFYYTTTAGIKVIDSTTATPASAGVSPATNIVSLVDDNTGGVGLWTVASTTSAYRCVWGKKDANGRVLLGRPSGRSTVAHSASQYVTGRVPAISDVTASHFFRVYRSEATTTGVDPPEDMYLVYENTGAAGHTAAIGTVNNTWPSGNIVVTKADHGFRAGMQVLWTQGTGETADLPSDVYDITSVTATTYTVTYAGATIPGANTVAGTIAPWSFQFKDYAPDSMLGDPLYTNPSDGEGDANSNEQPPVAKDIALWSDRVWFGNTTGKHRYYLSMLGIGTPDGVQDGDTISIAGQTYVAKTGGVVNDTQFAITGAATSATNIDTTARALVRVINENPRNTTVKAYYISGVNEVPGKIMIESTALGASTFYVAASRQESWNPYPPKVYEITEASSSRTSNVVTITTTAAHGFVVGDSVYLASDTPVSGFAAGVKTVATVPSTTTFTYAETGANATVTGTYRVFKATETSSNDTAVHRVYYSKFQQPEAVPLLNYRDIGSKNKAVLRIVTLRDKLYVLKEDGIFIVTGQAPFRVDLLDDTIRLLSPDSAVTVGNQIFALTYQGVVSISDAGVTVVSRPIENRILRTSLASANLANAKLGTFGVSYESERSYILWLASTSSTPTEAFVYNYMANTWTRWTMGRNCGRVSPSLDRLYMGATASSQIYRERKAMARADYVDAISSVTVDAVSSAGLESGYYLLTLNSSTTAFAGDFIIGSGWTARVTQTVADQFINVYVTSGTPAAGAATLNYGIACDLAWAAHTGGAPHMAKRYREAQVYFKRRNFYSANATFVSDLDQTSSSIELVFDDRAINTTGDLTTRIVPMNKRVGVPLSQMRASYLTFGFSISEAYAAWELNGHGLEFDAVSERSNK